jgi:ammonium transporter, Amt family
VSETLSAGDTAWLLISAALVLFMIPGLALFYGGMVRSKSVLNMLMMVMGALFVVGILWVLFGYSMAFGATQGGFVGSFTEYFGLESMLSGETEDPFPPMADAAFQAMFACLTVGLIAGAIADRTRYAAWLVFAAVWATLVYFPVAHWVWGDGWLGGVVIDGAEIIDFAGGTAVHINAGAAALALALVLGRRVVFEKGAHKPHNVPLVLLGASLLWFGWFGFNAGAEFLNSLELVGLIIVNTLGATAAAILGWLVVEKVKDGKPTAVGAASGAVAGLVAITPACANLAPGWALVLGVLAGVVSALAIELKFKLGFDDSLDVVGLHLVAGMIGTLYLGFFAIDTGLFTGGDFGQLIVQTIAAFGVLIYSFVVALILGLAIEKTIGFRVKNEDEVAGIDTVIHGGEAYDFVETK